MRVKITLACSECKQRNYNTFQVRSYYEERKNGKDEYFRQDRPLVR